MLHFRLPPAHLAKIEHPHYPADSVCYLASQGPEVTPRRLPRGRFPHSLHGLLAFGWSLNGLVRGFARSPSPYTVGPRVNALASGRSRFHHAFYGLFASDGSLNGLVCGFPRNPSRYTVGPTGQCPGIRNNAPRLNACWRSPSSLFDAILHIAMADHRYLSGP